MTTVVKVGAVWSRLSDLWWLGSVYARTSERWYTVNTWLAGVTDICNRKVDQTYSWVRKATPNRAMSLSKAPERSHCACSTKGILKIVYEVKKRPFGLNQLRLQVEKNSSQHLGSTEETLHTGVSRIQFPGNRNENFCGFLSKYMGKCTPENDLVTEPIFAIKSLKEKASGSILNKSRPWQMISCILTGFR